MAKTKDIKDVGHPKYLDTLPDYDTVRDCFQGSRKIKMAGVRYLPKLGNQTDLDYDNYKTRALFFPITGKTVSSLVGLATNKEAKLVYPDSMKAMFADNQRPFQFKEVLTEEVQELLLQGRYGMLIDAPVNGNVTDPSVVTYIAENIVNWQLDDKKNLEWVLLREYVWVEDPERGKFAKAMACRYRWCGLETRAGQTIYVVRIYDDELNLVGASIVPSFYGQVLDYVPFVCVGATGVHMEIDTPPMLDIATINVSHYMNSADLEWGRHIVGLPTPVITGDDSVKGSIKIGGTAAWIIPEPTAKAYYLEFQGQGLTTLENGLKEKINLMASISARLVDSSANGSESPDTVRMRYQSETSTLNQILNAAQSGLQLLYSWIAVIKGESKESVSIKLNHDVLGATLTGPILKELFAAYIEGAISKATLVYNLRRSDYLDPNVEDDAIILEMANQISPQDKLKLLQKQAEPPAPPPAAPAPKPPAK